MTTTSTHWAALLLKPVEPVAHAHIDCDWHDSVMVCLERVGPCWSSAAHS
jgi:hypothetical protein